MNRIEELTKQVLEHEDVPAPEVTTVVPHVRTNVIVPVPTWSRPSEQDDRSTEV